MDLSESENRIKAICGSHLPEWFADCDSVSVSALRGGCNNGVFKCTAIKQTHLSKTVIVRVITGNNSCTTATEAGEAIVLYALGEAGLGPKLLGVFNGGRIEEYLDGRMLTSLDLRNEEIRKSAAVRLAQLHSMDAPLPRVEEHDKARDLIKLGILIASEIKLETFPVHQQEVLKNIIDFDYEGQLEWAIGAIDKIQKRIVLNHGDFLVNNIMLCNGQIYMIDIENVAYSSRGSDIGHLLFESAYDYEDPNHLTVIGELSEEIMRHFISCYLEAWQRLNPHRFDKNLDTVDVVMVEAYATNLITTLLYTMVELMTVKREGAASDAFLNYIQTRKELYEKYKSWLVGQIQK